MHPDIKKFWEDAGKRLGAYESGVAHYYNDARGGVIYVASTYRFYQGFCKAFNIKPNPKLNILQDDDWVYLFQGKSYSEQEMLRLVKLKAFL